MRIYELLHDDKYYYIISEYVQHGDLYKYMINTENELTENDNKKIVKQIFLALNYMHARNIIHRDIKPENILISSIENHEIKLADFGFATIHADDDEADELNEVVGSPQYMSPELIQGNVYDSKIDIWSTGIVTYILLSGLIPFGGLSDSETINSILNDDLSFPEEGWSKISENAKDFVRTILTKDPEQRASC